MERGALLLVGALLLPLAACGDDAPGAATALSAAVHVDAEGCGDGTTVGSGAFVAMDRVLTVAHVVAGSTDVDVTLADGTEVDASVVAIDRVKDLALLAVDAEVAPLPLGRLRPGAKGTFVVWRAGDFQERPFTAIAFVDINASDIDRVGVRIRRGFELRADVERGDSGSVLVRDGQAVGVVFARSTTTAGRAWATDVREAAQLLRHATDLPVDVGPCP